MPGFTKRSQYNQCAYNGDGLIKGDPEVLDSAGVYGKPTHAQHVYLPYYEGQMLLMRKCVPSVCLRKFSILASHDYDTPLLCATSVLMLSLVLVVQILNWS